MSLSLSAPKRKAVRNTLELKLRRSKGTRLQEFLAALMVKVHGDKFTPVGTDYSRGDLKCDGLLSEPLTIFACYGPVNAGANATEAAMATAVKKVDSDFAGALKHWPNMQEWCFVYNYVEVPSQIAQKVLDLGAANPKIKIRLFGKEQFENHLLALDLQDIEDLVGDAATEEDFQSLQPAEVLTVVAHLMESVAGITLPEHEPFQVPDRKLHFNGLSDFSKSRILSSIAHVPRVAKLLEGHQNPLLDGQIATTFNAKYLELKSQGFEPDDIMFELYDFTAAGAKISATREVAIWGLLAHLFEKCTIFEQMPVGDAA